MICIIALVVFGILGIFSLTYRRIAADALDCVFKRVTFRKCDTGLDKKLKSQLLGGLIGHSPKLGRFLYRYFEVFSWAFIMLTLVTLFFVGLGAYNYAVYGNCNGPGSKEFCIFDPLVKEQISTCNAAGVTSTKVSDLDVSKIDNGLFMGSKDSKVTLVQFGCYSCPFTRKAQEDFNRIANDYRGKIKYTYINFPITTHEKSTEVAIMAECVRAQSQDIYWKYKDIFFTENAKEPEFITSTFEKVSGIDISKLKTCIEGNETNIIVDQDLQLASELGIYGTPTFFIDGKPYVGPQTYKTFKVLLDKELSKKQQ